MSRDAIRIAAPQGRSELLDNTGRSAARRSVVAVSSWARRRVSRSSPSPLRPPACGANSTGGMCLVTCSQGAANRSTRRSASSSGAITALISVVGAGVDRVSGRSSLVAVDELLLDRLVVGFDGLQVVEQRLGAQRADGRTNHVERPGTVRDEVGVGHQRLLRRGRVGHPRARVQVEEQAVGGTVGGCALDRAGRLPDRHVVGDATVEEQEGIRPGGPEVDVTDQLIGLDPQGLERHGEGRGRSAWRGEIIGACRRDSLSNASRLRRWIWPSIRCSVTGGVVGSSTAVSSVDTTDVTERKTSSRSTTRVWSSRWPSSVP